MRGSDEGTEGRRDGGTKGRRDEGTKGRRDEGTKGNRGSVEEIPGILTNSKNSVEEGIEISALRRKWIAHE